MDDVSVLRRLQNEFVRERDWGQFHTPKNVAMALGGEVGELAGAISQLKYPYTHDGHDASTEVSDEVGDVTLYLLRLHDLLDVPVEFSVNALSESPTSREPAMLVSEVFKLMASVGRLLEVYQWTVEGEPLDAGAQRQAANWLVTAGRDLVSVCGLLSINPIAAATVKLAKNREKYPVASSRGTSRKYTEIQGR